MPEIGEKVPDFALYDQNRKLRQMSEFLVDGHKTIFAFFPGAFTGVCTQEACAFRDMSGELETLKGNLVGISVDSPFANKGFVDKNQLTFTLLSDHKREVVQKYGVTWTGLGGIEGYVSANRAIFVTDDSGKVLFKWIAADPGVIPPFDAVKKALV